VGDLRKSRFSTSSAPYSATTVTLNDTDSKNLTQVSSEEPYPNSSIHPSHVLLQLPLSYHSSYTSRAITMILTHITLLSVWLATTLAHPTIPEDLSSPPKFQYDPLTSGVVCSVPTTALVESNEQTKTVTVFTTRTTTVWAPKGSSTVLPEHTVTLTTHTTSTTTIFPSGTESTPTSDPSLPTCNRVSAGNAEPALPDSQYSVSVSSVHQPPTHQLDSHGLLDLINRKGQRLISRATLFDLQPRVLAETRNTSAETPVSEKRGGGGAAAGAAGGLRSISSLTNPACKNGAWLVSMLVVSLGLLILRI